MTQLMVTENKRPHLAAAHSYDHGVKSGLMMPSFISGNWEMNESFPMPMFTL